MFNLGDLVIVYGHPKSLWLTPVGPRLGIVKETDAYNVMIELDIRHPHPTIWYYPIKNIRYPTDFELALLGGDDYDNTRTKFSGDKDE